MNIKNKDFLYPLSLLFCLLFLFILNWQFFGNMLYDCGREYLVPVSYANGKILIKDIFISYFPLSYQINALVLKLFKENLDVLRVMGAFSALISALLYYFIARFFCSEKKSLIISFIASFFTMINVSFLFNYILGYSFACIYAVPCILSGALCILYYLKKEKFFIYLSSFLFGTAFGLKIEFVFLLIPLISILIYKKEGFKTFLLTGIYFLIPLFSSFLILFIQGFNLDDLKNYFEFLYNFINSKTLAQYTYTVTRKDPSKWLGLASGSFVQAAALFISYFVILYFPIKKERKILSKILSVFLFFILCIYAVLKGNFVALSYFTYLSIFGFLILFYLIYSIKKDGVENKKAGLIFLILISLSLVIRHNFIYTANHSAYTMGIMTVSTLVFIYLFYQNETLKKILTIFLISLGIANALYFTTYNRLFPSYEIKTSRGIFKTTNEKEAEIFNKTLEFINSTPDNSSVLILPEGHMFNFLSNRKTDLRYYQLLPNHIETLGEEKIVSGLKKEMPDYILITTGNYGIYGSPEFCRDFGQKICMFILSNYSQIKDFSNAGDLSVYVYKK